MTVHILVAHAHRSTRSFITETLRDEGFEVSQVADGVDLVDELQISEDGFDLVVSSVQLPECSGLDVLQEIREQGDDTPFLLLLNGSDADCSHEAEALDASVLEQPFDADELVVIVQAIIEERLSSSGEASERQALTSR